jgi:catechol O-methyltransferase
MYKLSPQKANVLKNTILKYNPQTILELGTFLGYSALNVASVMSPKSMLISIEGNTDNAAVAKHILSKALGSYKINSSVRIVNDISTQVLQNITSLRTEFQDMRSTSTGTPLKFDLVFMDHDKDCYTKDLMLLEQQDLLADQCIIVADNVVFPGAPGYLEYVNCSSSTSTSTFQPKSTTHRPSASTYQYSTKLVSVPFERVGFETQFKEVNDAMSITEAVRIQ